MNIVLILSGLGLSRLFFVANTQPVIKLWNLPRYTWINPRSTINTAADVVIQQIYETLIFSYLRHWIKQCRPTRWYYFCWEFTLPECFLFIGLKSKIILPQLFFGSLSLLSQMGGELCGSKRLPPPPAATILDWSSMSSMLNSEP